MTKISRDELKKRGFKRFLNSIKYSLDGIKYAIKNEQSMLIYSICIILAITLAIVLKIKTIEAVIILISMGVVLGAELINTAIEAVVDLVTLEIHPLAKIAKDCGSAATFVFSIMTLIIGLVIYVPYIIELFK